MIIKASFQMYMLFVSASLSTYIKTTSVEYICIHILYCKPCDNKWYILAIRDTFKKLNLIHIKKKTTSKDMHQVLKKIRLKICIKCTHVTWSL